MARSLPVIVAVKNRPELTQQAVESCLANTAVDIQLILVNDASNDQRTLDYLNSINDPRVTVINMMDAKSCGAVKNAGAAIAEPHKFIYFSDNDVFFHKNWLEKMVATLTTHPKVAILGGDRHPYHDIKDETNSLIYSSQQVGYSMLMRQSVWRKLGPFQHAGLGEYGIEDTAICNKAKMYGYRVAALRSRVLTHCGLTKSSGEPAEGYEIFVKQKVPASVVRL